MIGSNFRISVLYMSHQGTWADALVIQAVADALNLTLHIISNLIQDLQSS